MPLPLRPHSASYKGRTAVTKTVGTTAGVKVGAKEASGAATTILGQLDELTTTQALEWGVEAIEEQVAGVFRCNVADAATIEPRGELTISGVVWTVQAMKTINHGLALDHVEILVMRDRTG